MAYFSTAEKIKTTATILQMDAKKDYALAADFIRLRNHPRAIFHQQSAETWARLARSCLFDLLGTAQETEDK